MGVGIVRGTSILEADFAGIEQVIMGWLMNEPAHIRLAKLGMHAYVASHALKRPADLRWSDEDLKACFKEIKESTDDVIYETYDRSKRGVHGNAYGLTVYGMVQQFPKAFPTLKAAQAIYDVYFAVAPWVPTFQGAVQHTAYHQHFLGGVQTYQYLPTAPKLRVIGHPYGYRHDFYDVVGYERLTESARLWRDKRKMPCVEFNGVWYAVKLGEDAKRAIAFLPQSIARGVLTEAALDLFLPPDHPEHCPDLYIGDAYYGRTPLRAPIHDSLLLEVPTRIVEKVMERVFTAMRAGVEELPCPAAWGIGPYLTIGVDAKIGKDWSREGMAKLSPSSVASDSVIFAADDRDSEGRSLPQDHDVEDLETRVA